MLLSLSSFLILDSRRSNYDIAPDGEHSLFLQSGAPAADDGGAAGGFIVVQNWFEELRRLVPTN